MISFNEQLDFVYVFALWVDFADGPLSSLGKYAANIEPKTNFTAFSKRDSKDDWTEHE